MSSVGKAYIYEQVHRVLGAQADEWLDTPQPGLGEGPRDTPRALIESGCRACIESVLVAVEQIEVAS